MNASWHCPEPVEPTTTERIACYREKLVANAIIDLEDWSVGDDETPRLSRFDGTPPLLRDRTSLRWSARHARILGTGRPSERKQAPRRGPSSRRPAPRWQPTMHEAANRS